MNTSPSQTKNLTSAQIKQKAFSEGLPFKIATEPSTNIGYHYHPDSNLVKSNNNTIVGVVLEISNFSVKVRVDILGIPTVVYARYEYMVFGQNTGSI